MVSGPWRGIFVFELLFFHSTPCFFGFSGLIFPEFRDFRKILPQGPETIFDPPSAQTLV